MQHHSSHTGIIAILSILSALLTIAACSKKAPELQPEAKPAEAIAEAPKTEESAPEAKPAEAIAEAPKAQEPVQDTKPVEIPKTEKSDADLTIDELEAKYKTPGGERMVCDLDDPDGPYSCKAFEESGGCHCNRTACYCPNGNPITAGEDADFEYKNLAINPADCTVTCCKENEGCQSGLECNTKSIVDAGFYLGSTVYRVGYIMRGGTSCIYQGEQWEKCFLQKQEFENYIKVQNLNCAPGEDNECLYENDDCEPDDE